MSTEAKAAEPKNIELWEGFEVAVNMQLLDDFDFTVDLQAALNSNDVGTLMTMYMALVGGDVTYEKVRSHIEEENGYLSQTELLKIMDKINAVFPKSGNRAQRRSWKNLA
jgi:hypothetical protein